MAFGLNAQVTFRSCEHSAVHKLLQNYVNCIAQML